MSSSIRRAAVAGAFYPAMPGALRGAMTDWLSSTPAAADAARGPAPKLLVVPHAGYVYSGPIAAQAYALLAPWRGRIERVVLLGPAHRVAVRGLAVPTTCAFETPLGAVAVDRASIDALAALPQVVSSDVAHAHEHSLEVQLPFLQAVLGSFSIVPFVVGRAAAGEVAEVLERTWGGDETLVVVSTDLSHYLPYAHARAADAATVEQILALDASIDHDQACGATPLNGALRVARARGLAPRLLELRNSGDTAGDRSRVVGYGAIGFWPDATGVAPAEAADAEARVAHDSAHDDALGAALLSRARNAIAAALGLPQVAEPSHPALAAPGATFVTLRRAGELRGCIGRLEAGEHSLDEDVRRNARRAAFEDPRFPSLGPDEWPGLAVEVSLLGALEPVAAATESDACRVLRPHEDGVVLDWRGRRATFLPQVWAQMADAREFLSALRRKAGLPTGFWHEELTLSRYRVLKYADGEVPA
ncbi:MAG: AmmeMemoRadiSam system protein B [Steroidobacteraceae bacterium]|nr:AmmeMemoRadiSam system protein B [Steroidobacteraceae bacterium]